MKLTKKKAKIVEEAIDMWVAEDFISGDKGRTLRESLEIIRFDWKRLAKYSFWIALICIIIAVGTVVADKALMALFAKIFRAPALIKCLFFALAAGALYYTGVVRKRKKPEKLFSNEAVFFLGVLATAAAIAFFGRAIDTGSGHFSLLLLIASLIYGVLGLWFPSKLVWFFALLSLGGWFGAETGYVSGWGAYYLGMNFPLRFVLFGIAITLGSALFSFRQSRQDFLKPTRVMGLLYLFIALWIMSIFGNYGDMHSWYKVKQFELVHWAVLFGAAAVAAIFHGIKCDDGMTRGFGLVFLFINLYTRFFEYFWNSLHKAIFFAVLAASFWYIGTRAERIWNISRASAPPEETAHGEST
jgi:hypothetical protein